MAALAVMSVMLAAVGTRWAEDKRREQEQELIRVGTAYARAIASYRASSPGSVAMAPRRLEDLVLDDRFPKPRRHLRQLYADPVARLPWGLITDADGRIQGVYSRSDDAPLRQVALDAGGGIALPAAARYSDWKFIVREGKR
jgi:type II secretory pathway pseudopilin PulG